MTKIQAWTFIGVMLLCGIACAGMSDNFTLTITEGEPKTKPNPASIEEDVKFKFATKLVNKQTGQEAKPEDVKSVLYTLSDAPAIKSCSPAMIFSSDKKSVSGSTDSLQDVTATLVYKTVGYHTLTLNVTVTLTDTSTISASCSIPVNVYRAAITVYAQKTKITIQPNKNGDNVPFFYPGNSVGHSFWRVDVYPPELLSAEERTVNGNEWGHYPKDKLSRKKALDEVDGAIKDDHANGPNGGVHEHDASHIFLITLDDAKSALAETKKLKEDNNLKYHLTNEQAQNCTGQCVRIANDFAKAGSPIGKGRIWTIKRGIFYDTEGSYNFSNPYHHVLELGKLSKP